MTIRTGLAAMLVAGVMLSGQAMAADYKAPDSDYTTIEKGTYVLDNNHASVVWRLWHMGLSHFAGRFDSITGTALVNPDDPTKCHVEVTIDPKSVDTNVAKLDEELAGKDWFDVTDYPKITFKSTKLEIDGKDVEGKRTGKLYGDLTLHGVTRPIVLNVTFNGHGESPIENSQRLGFSASGMLKRSDYGMKMYVPLVGDEVEFRIAVEFSKAA